MLIRLQVQYRWLSLKICNKNNKFRNFGLGVLSSSCTYVRTSVRYRDISETKSCRATNFGYVMYLVNCGKPIEIGHARHRIYGVMPLFQLFSILWYLWNKITFGHQIYIYYVSSEFWEAYWNWACSSNDLRSYAPFSGFCRFRLFVPPSITVISETKSSRATKFGYVMYLVNCGKPIEIEHARQRIYRVMPLFQLLFIPWYLWNKITFGHYRDISETKSRRPTKFGYVMYLVNCGKPIEIGHARQRIMHDHRSHQTFIKLHLEVWHDLFILYMSVHWDHMLIRHCDWQNIWPYEDKVF